MARIRQGGYTRPPLDPNHHAPPSSLPNEFNNSAKNNARTAATNQTDHGPGRNPGPGCRRHEGRGPADPPAPALGSRAHQPAGPLYRQQRRQAPAPAAGAAGGAGLRLRRRAPSGSGRHRRIHPHRHPAARRRGGRLRPAPRPRDRQCHLGQRGQRAGGGFSVFARLRDDGGSGQHAGDGDPGPHHQHHRRRRGHAAAQLPRPGHHRSSATWR